MALPDNERFLGQRSPLHSEARSLSPRRDGSLVDFEDINLRALRYLLQDKNGRDHFRIEDIEQVAQAAIADPSRIQLIDFVDQIGLSSEVISGIRVAQDAIVPAQRRPFFEKYQKLVSATASMPPELSAARLNPFTEFENQPPLLFGMGGGSKALCKGLPIDVLSMVLTAEKLRRELGLGRCKIICANGITYTNIPNNSDFSKEGIDRVMAAERDLLRMAVDRFGIGDHFDIFLETDIEQIIGPDLKKEYDRMIEDADTVPFIGGHHYSIEMAQMYSLLNQEHGGVKLGWFIRPLSKVKPEYIMDEQPFDARYVTYLAYRGLTNKISIPYAKAGVRIFPGATGQIDKDAPYICYDPGDRILLSPFENPAKKLEEATRAGGGLKSQYIRGYFGTIVKLFEEIVLGKDLLPALAPRQEPDGAEHMSARQRRKAYKQQAMAVRPRELVYRAREIDDEILDDNERFTPKGKARDSHVAQRLQYILDYVFEGNRAEAEKIYKAAFPRGVGL